MDEIKQLTIRINMKLYEEIKNLAKEDSRPINREIEHILKKYIELRK